jgi:hypothetical protein
VLTTEDSKEWRHSQPCQRTIRCRSYGEAKYIFKWSANNSKCFKVHQWTTTLDYAARGVDVMQTRRLLKSHIQKYAAQNLTCTLTRWSKRRCFEKKKLIYTSTNPTRTNVAGSRMLMYLELQFRNCSHGRWWTTHRPKNFDRWMLAKFQISTIRSISKLRISTCFFGQISIEVWDGASAAGAQGAAGICHVEVTLSELETALLQQRNAKKQNEGRLTVLQIKPISTIPRNHTMNLQHQRSAPCPHAVSTLKFQQKQSITSNSKK